MNTNISRKRTYIQIASRILKEEGIAGLTIRRVAKEAGCTSAVLYKHFENLDHLIVLASIPFLRPYMEEFQRITERKDLTSIQQMLCLWRAFIREAYRYRPYYTRMYLSPDRDKLEKYIYEYYIYFPEEKDDFNSFSTSVIFNSDLSKRDYIFLQYAIADGLITIENARLLDQISIPLFEGIFFRTADHGDDPAVLEKDAAECFSLIVELFRKFVRPKTKLDIPDI